MTAPMVVVIVLCLTVSVLLALNLRRMDRRPVDVAEQIVRDEYERTVT